MKKPNFAQTLEIIATFGVIAGLVFLTIELKQNNEMMRASARSTITQAIINDIQLWMEPRIVSARAKTLSGEQLTEEDEYLLGSAANATLRLMENTHYHYRNGLFDEAEFEADRMAWRQIMQEPEFMKRWADTRMEFSEAFRNEIDRIVRDSRQQEE